ncbi:MAG: metal ABC transporter solute-binding protein, Zn/Mn family [Smithellaceae bacterium]
MPSKKIFIYLLLVLPIIYSCQNSRETAQPDNKLRVIATIFPLYDMACNIGGDKVKVSMLLPPSTDAHNFELKPNDIIRISKADLFLYVNMEMEHWAYKVIAATSSNTRLIPVETGSGITMLPLAASTDGEEDHHSSKFDPHIWLDFNNAQKMADNIAVALVKIDPRHSDYYLKNVAEYKNKLALLDNKFRTGLTGCKSRMILHAGHWAFAYLANKYGLKYYSVYNVSADSEPEPQKITAMISQIRDTKALYIYSEELINPRLAETISSETGASLLKLNNGHTISKAEMSRGVSFLSLMEENLINLKKGLQCR